MEFACSHCTYKSSRTIDVFRHINKIKQCRPGIKQIITLNVDATCKLCGHDFTNAQTLKRHQKTSCKISELEKKISDLSTKITNNTAPVVPVVPVGPVVPVVPVAPVAPVVPVAPVAPVSSTGLTVSITYW